MWAFSEHDRNEIKISLLTLEPGPISRFPVAALAKTVTFKTSAKDLYAFSCHFCTLEWKFYIEHTLTVQLLFCESSGTGKPGWSVHFDSRSVHEEKKISTMSPAWTFIRSQRKIFMDIATVYAGSKILSNNNRIRFHILNSNFQNLINKTTVCVN